MIVSQYHFNIIQDELEPQNAPGFYDYRGVTHVHTNLNLGTSSVAESIKAGQEVGLDFMFITDLNVLARDFSVEGYHRKTMVLVAGAYSYLDSRILLYDAIERHNIESLGQAQVLLADLLSQKGPDAARDLLILAHPFKSGFKWSGPYPEALDGIEVINLKSIWQHAWLKSKISFLWSVLVYPFNADLAFLRLYTEPRDEIELWNHLSLERPTIGMAGTEATARTGSVGEFYLRFPSYQVSFSMLSNHLLLRSELTGDFDKDKRKLLSALSKGEFYMALDLLGNPKGFSFYLQDGDRTEPMGSELRWKKGMKLFARLPRKPKVPFETVVLKDGERIMSSTSIETEYDVHERGVYRVVVRVIPTLPLPDGKRWLPWIYSNPIYVR